MALAASACVDDEALFALARGELGQDDVEAVFAHLKDCADCRAVLAEAARALAPAGDDSAAERAPTRIARYEIVALLGAGAAGVVYRAFDPQLRRQVALKLLRPELHGQNPEQSARLLREAQAMARLSDPHVVTVYDVGLHEGRVYLVMEFIDGVTLSEWLRKAPRKREEILKVFADAGAGLGAAHQKGLVHRDFKPENVLVAKTGRASVTDFGLARESESWLGLDGAADDRAITELYAPTRGLVGTPAYMAPELFEGATASSASDQFAFCVALYGALFERHPFKAGEGIALSELITRVRGDAPLKPAFRSTADERLFGVLARGLSPSPAARFAGLAELLAALHRANGQRFGGPKTGWILAGLGGIAAAAAALLLWPRTEPQALPTAPSALTAAESELPAAATVVSTAAAPEPSAAAPQSASATPDKERAPGAKPTERRRPPKPSEVRYKDWLKDPF